jgi:hypothetical protein
MRLLVAAPFVLVIGCASGSPGSPDGGGSGKPDADVGKPDGGCQVEVCDADGDGVVDPADMCPDTPAGEPVNHLGCSDSQVDPVLNPNFPPYNLAFDQSGDIGRPGGLTWTYGNIQRGDLFHIYWIVCDDPTDGCGLSLDGAIDVTAENWFFSGAQSDLAHGKLVYTNSTQILHADASTAPLNGRLTINVVDITNTPMPLADVGTLGVTARTGTHGLEIPGTGFVVNVIAEVQDASQVWTPYLDYYDAAQTPETGSSASVSFGGYFYDE